MKRLAIGTANDLLARLKRSQLITPLREPVYVNLGSSMTVAPGWINIDGSPNTALARLPVPMLRLAYRFTGATTWYSESEYIDKLKSHQFVHHDLMHGIPLSDNRADVIYSSHFIEHLYRCDAERLIRECLRVLKPGGLLRLCVPDLAIAVETYLAGRVAEALAYFFVDRGASPYDRHFYMYDFGTLGALLEATGFSDIVRCRYREGRVPNLDVLDNRPDETLYVEARKPDGNVSVDPHRQD